jgi:hypothetical protein
MFDKLHRIRLERLKKINFFIKEYNFAFENKINNIIKDVITNKIYYSADTLLNYHIEPVYNHTTKDDIAKYIILENFENKELDIDAYNIQLLYIKNRLHFNSIFANSISKNQLIYQKQNIFIDYYKKIIFDYENIKKDKNYEQRSNTLNTSNKADILSEKKLIYHCLKFDFSNKYIK